jgi:ATP-dependent Clp protease adaptor protein ClpS
MAATASTAMRPVAPRFAGTRPMIAPSEVEATETVLALQGPWRVVVLNDPVNSMSYVVLVFRKVFGFAEPRARRHMLEVHEQGRSVVWSGLREQAELYAFALQQWHLTAILESDEAH